MQRIQQWPETETCPHPAWPYLIGKGYRLTELREMAIHEVMETYLWSLVSDLVRGGV